MNPNELRKLKERAPLPLIVLLILFLLPSILIEPENQALNAAAESCDAAVKSARAAVRNREAYRVQTEKLQHLLSVRQDFQAVLPAESRLPAIIDQLQQLALASSVSVEEVRYEFNHEFDKLPVPSYRLQMNLKAEYSGMRSFLAAIENLESPVIIQEIVLIEGSRYALTMRLLVK